MLNIKDGKGYIDYVRKTPCFICGRMGVDADHLSTIGMGGDREGVSINDFTCIPLCREHHSERHSNHSKFEEKYKINLWKELFFLFRGVVDI